MPEPLKPTDNLPAEAARGRSQFVHAMIYAGIFLILGLAVALVVIKVRGKQLIPGDSNPHPTSMLMSIDSNSTSA